MLFNKLKNIIKAIKAIFLQLKVISIYIDNKIIIRDILKYELYGLKYELCDALMVISSILYFIGIDLYKLTRLPFRLERVSYVCATYINSYMEYIILIIQYRVFLGEGFIFLFVEILRLILVLLLLYIFYRLAIIILHLHR